MSDHGASEGEQRFSAAAEQAFTETSLLNVELTPDEGTAKSWANTLTLYARTVRLAVALVDLQGQLLGTCYSPQSIWSLAAQQDRNGDPDASSAWNRRNAAPLPPTHGERNRWYWPTTGPASRILPHRSLSADATWEYCSQGRSSIAFLNPCRCSEWSKTSVFQRRKYGLRPAGSLPLAAPT